ncbi:MAG: SUMF1/EgtB/PvdO family nonheme iron enzyme [Myxococcales bacterium]|nr:SUMF1/EgtB/PvdO family nonheme iron enzyme [Myxococcales bacterium]
MEDSSLEKAFASWRSSVGGVFKPATGTPPFLEMEVRRESGTVQSVDAVFSEPGFRTLVAPAGAGKTSCARRAIHRLATGDGDVLPVYVALATVQDFAVRGWWADSAMRSLAIYETSQADAATALLWSVVEEVCLVLDGFDEVAPIQRPSLVAALEELRWQLPRATVVLMTRWLEDVTLPRGYEQVELLGLSQQQQSEVLLRWFGVRDSRIRAEVLSHFHWMGRPTPQELLAYTADILKRPVSSTRGDVENTGHHAPAWARSGQPPTWAVEWGEDEHGVFVAFAVGEVVQRLRWIPPGEFLIGSPEDEEGRTEDEGARRLQRIEYGFWLGETPITQALWQAVRGENPSQFRGDSRPVENISFAEAQAFLEAASESLGLPIRLPSEEEWEYAARAGTATPHYAGFERQDLAKIAWYEENSGGETHPVGEKAANDFGLHDMAGNVNEFCASSRPGLRGVYAVVRGGSAISNQYGCRHAQSGWVHKHFVESDMLLGMRIVVEERQSASAMRAAESPESPVVPTRSAQSSAVRSVSVQDFRGIIRGLVERQGWSLDESTAASMDQELRLPGSAEAWYVMLAEVLDNIRWHQTPARSDGREESASSIALRLEQDEVTRLWSLALGSDRQLPTGGPGPLQVLNNARAAADAIGDPSTTKARAGSGLAKLVSIWDEIRRMEEMLVETEVGLWLVAQPAEEPLPGVATALRYHPGAVRLGAGTNASRRAQEPVADACHITVCWKWRGSPREQRL